MELSTGCATTTTEQKDDGEERERGRTGEGGLDAHLPRCNRTMDGTTHHRPAHQTKSEKILRYSGYSLCQSDDGATNGTTLWLGGQILSAYLPTLRTGPGKAIELGSGIGLSACDASLPPALSSTPLTRSQTHSRFAGLGRCGDRPPKCHRLGPWSERLQQRSPCGRKHTGQRTRLDGGTGILVLDRHEFSLFPLSLRGSPHTSRASLRPDCDL